MKDFWDQRWITEFGCGYQIPSEIMDLVAAGELYDDSWHNDTCPKFDTSDPKDDGEGFLLWVEHSDPEEREIAGMRFFVQWHDATYEDFSKVLETDDLAEVLRTII